MPLTPDQEVAEHELRIEQMDAFIKLKRADSLGTVEGFVGRIYSWRLGCGGIGQCRRLDRCPLPEIGGRG